MSSHSLKAPFPYFGGKSRVAPQVWERFGDVPNYIEPFAGSLAVLLGRPTAPRVETVNDVDAAIANLWRALLWAPDEVAYWADYPVNETDLHSRHRWLVQQLPGLKAKLMADPNYYDAKIAGWDVWGRCLWIGSGWCQDGMGNKLPALSQGGNDRSGNGRGVLSESVRRWQGGGKGGGSGVHAPSLSQQKPLLRGDSGATGQGINGAAVASVGLYNYLNDLAARLRLVRVCCGDWTRVLTPSVTTYMGVTGVFLDPPYSHDLRERCYAEDHDISADVRAWALEHGDDPNFRIALCGYEGEHQMPDSWSVVAWKAHGGYSRTERGVENRSKERLWFSPHCLNPAAGLPFDTSELETSEVRS